jgi:hypothetical protein
VIHTEDVVRTHSDSRVSIMAQTYTKYDLRFHLPDMVRLLSNQLRPHSDSHQSWTSTRYRNPVLAGSARGQFFDPLV